MNFDYFTKNAQTAVRDASSYAHQLEADAIEPEHLLLSTMFNTVDSTGKKALLSLKLDFLLVMQEVKNHSPSSESSVSSSSGTTKQVVFSEKTKEAIRLAVSEANKSKGETESLIGTEHLLLGILLSENLGSTILRMHHITPDKIKEKLAEGFEHIGDHVFESIENGDADALDNEHLPYLERYATDLTKKAKEGKIDPVIGRFNEIERTIQILSRKRKSNPLLIGEPGVGKTAIAEGLALDIHNGKAPKKLKNHRVFSLSASDMIGGTMFRGQFEERLQGIIDEMVRHGKIILFLDEIHTLVGSGSTSDSMDGAQILKPALARGDIKCIGATTMDEYRRYFEKDSALSRRFITVPVEEPSVEDSILILNGLLPFYESFHGVTYQKDIVRQAVKLSKRYITDRFLPDKAIDLIDESGARLSLQENASETDQLLSFLEEKMKVIDEAYQEAVLAVNFAESRSLMEEKKNLQQEISEEREKLKASDSKEVTVEHLENIIFKWTGIPVEKASKEQGKKLLQMESSLQENVVGQKDAISAVSKAIRRSRSGLSNPNKPIASFMFLGPTGVGKTELAKSLAKELFGDKNALIRIDMSEYMEKHTLTKLIGSPPGYVGYEDGGQLTKKVRNKPFSIVLLDEIEKAHPDIFDAFLQILDDGHITDGHGRRVDFKNTIIIMTSNIGTREIFNTRELGFGSQNKEAPSEQSVHFGVLEELSRSFRPEFLNRIDQKIIFHPLTKEELIQIVEILFADISKRVEDLNLSLTLSESAKNQLVEEGHDPKNGARPLQRTIQTQVEDLLSDALLNGDIVPGNSITIDFKEKKFFFVINS